MPTLKIYELIDYGYRIEFSNSYYRHGKDGVLPVGVAAYGNGTDGYSYRSCLIYNLNTIPQNVIITNATLNLKVQTGIYWANLPDEYGNLEVHTITENWNVNDLRYEYPSFTRDREDIIGKTQSEQWSILNVTNSVKKMYANTTPNYGWLLKHQKDTYVTEYQDKRYFYNPNDADIANRPYLMVEYSYSPPNTPTNLNPSNNELLLKSNVIRLSWQHNPVISGEAQKGYTIQWRKQGTTTWNTISQTTANQYYDVPANTFTAGIIEWEVSTTDPRDSTSAYSNIALFVAGEIPTTPTITAPTTIVSNPLPTVVWTATNQAIYTLTLTDTSNISLWSYTGNETDTRTKQLAYTLDNNKSYKILLKIKNTDGYWSDNAVLNITTNFLTPPQPTYNTTTNNTRGSISFAIVNPQETGNNPVVMSNEIFRRAEGIQNWQRIAINVAKNGLYTDYTVQPDTDYEYKVRAIGSTMAYTESTIITLSAKLQISQLALTSDYSKYLNLAYCEEKKKHVVYEATKLQFVNREYPVSEFSGHKNLFIELRFSLTKQQDLDLLEDMIASKRALLYRDNRGRKVFGTIESYYIEDCYPYYYKVSCNLNAVDFNGVA